MDVFTLQQCYAHPFDHLCEVAHLHVNLRRLQFLRVGVKSACYMSTDLLLWTEGLASQTRHNHVPIFLMGLIPVAVLDSMTTSLTV